MTAAPLTRFHLTTLWLMRERGPQPCRKGEVARLIKEGLIEAEGGRGQFGMTFYRLTAEGRKLAAEVTL